ncbi:MAG TPA: DUF5668 domain-containing protein [Candidatus Baltobacteraceae bacterium]|nr:DUF5668 domain-containing protein [Candidatus Baltobacteraceae bacterium]
MYNPDKRFTGPGVLIGVWITLLGVIFLLDQLGIVSAHISFHFVWPGILIALGLWGVFSTNPGKRFWGVVALTWGAFSLSNALGYMRFGFGSLWPLILIALGVAMLLNSSGKFGYLMRWRGPFDPSSDPSHDPMQMPPPEPAQNPAPDPAQRSAADPPQGPAPDPAAARPQEPPRDVWPDPTRSSFSGGPRSQCGPTGTTWGPPAASFFGVNHGPGNTDDPRFDQSVMLSGFKRRVTSQRFRYGKVTAILGGFQLDFTRADIDGDRAVIHIDTVFGGGEIRVPENWRITVEATAIAGAFVDETYPPPSGSPVATKQLIVRGAAIFGGVNIKN